MNSRQLSCKNSALPLSYHPNSSYWRKKDLNLRLNFQIVLQTIAINHSAISPKFPRAGIEPASTNYESAIITIILSKKNLVIDFFFEKQFFPCSDWIIFWSLLKNYIKFCWKTINWNCSVNIFNFVSIIIISNHIYFLIHSYIGMN